MKNLFLPLFAALTLTSNSQAAPINPTDSISLVRLYDATNGDNWNNAWDLADPASSWYGVTVNKKGSVVALDLRANNLEGELPKMGLKYATSVNLSDNELIGTMPSFNAFVSLEYLNLSKNGLEGSIPNLYTLTSLQHLDLSENHFTGVLPTFMDNVEMAVLKLNNNYIGGDIIDFPSLVNLTELHLNNNRLEGMVPDFQNMPALQRIYIGNNDLTGPVPNFTNMFDLTIFNAAGNQLTGKMPNFAFIPNLGTLDLSNNTIDGPLPEFTNLPNLRKLYLQNNSLSDEIPTFQFCFQLADLRLNNNHFEAATMIAAPSLFLIDVSENRLTFDDILSVLNIANSNSFAVIYDNQASFGAPVSMMAKFNNPVTFDLAIDHNVSTNVYTWYKDGVYFTTVNGNNTLTINQTTAKTEGVYTCVVTNPNASMETLESSTFTLTTNAGTTATTVTDISVTVYPNPTTNTISIATPFKSGAKIQVINNQGTVIQSVDAKSDITQIDVTSLAAGNYFVQYQDNDSNTTKPFIKK